VSDAILEHAVLTIITLVIIAYLVRGLDGGQ
jgi:hypothetical protein